MVIYYVYNNVILYSYWTIIGHNIITYNDMIMI